MSQSHLDLGWMRVLVETVRSGSFSGAATTLGLTQPAVSYQIRRVEEQVGFSLFRRQRQGVELTAPGFRLHEIARRAVDEADALVREHEAAARRPVAKLHTDYAFSSLWLIPRMGAFRSLYPDIDIQIIATQRVKPRDMGDSDIAIAFGERREFGSDARLLLPEVVVPVCSRDYLAQHGLGHEAAGLARSRLIHLDAAEQAPWFDWQAYFAAFGVSRVNVDRQGDFRFNTYWLVAQTAAEHQGVALGWLGLIDGYMRSGLLVKAGPPLRAPDRGYWLVGPRSAGSPGDRFVSWLADVHESVGAVDQA
ncbi:MAG: LysR substrate-binding domain-containing protein [Hyphomicrobiales bacterium]|nr:LysR substrate-binding domain-containing protein [Hyphomicrobiales bacterium]